MNNRTLLKIFSALFLLMTFSLTITSCIKDSEDKEIDTNTLVNETYPSGKQLSTDEWNHLIVDLNTCKVNFNATAYETPLDTNALTSSIELSVRFLDAYYELHYGAKINNTTLSSCTAFKTICDELDDYVSTTYEYQCLTLSRDILYQYNNQMKLITIDDENIDNYDIIRIIHREYPDYMLPYENYELAILVSQTSK